jgi:NADH:ubiquinone oxidoreductase subunit 5 (subunit L)/multisubunit Na+/H+ antiporter MnhA subunit
MQHDLKRLLAYHSVENIGIILLGLGMSMVFIGFGHPAPGVLALIAALYHTLNHAVFKGLLFLGAGSILHSTGLRNLNDMGGLIRGMPRTAFYFLIGALAISALPPLNGFVRVADFRPPPDSPSARRRAQPPAVAATSPRSALTAMCFVKVTALLFRPGARAGPSIALAPRRRRRPDGAGMAGFAPAASSSLFPTSFLLC